MEPSITDSDIIVVNTAKTQPTVKDIVSYRHTFDGNYIYRVIHRVIKIVDGEYITQGDAYAKTDGYTVASEDVIGVMFFKIPYIGALVHFAATTKGLLIRSSAFLSA